jgi:hypothetical protein
MKFRSVRASRILTIAAFAAFGSSAAFAQATKDSKGQTVPMHPASGAVGQSAPANTTAGIQTTANLEGILRAKGATHFVKATKANRIDKELKLTEGITATPDGAVTMPDGKKHQLQEGQMVTLAGEVVNVGANPTGIVFATGTTSTTGNVGRPETVNTPNTQGKLDPKDPPGIPGGTRPGTAEK